MQPAYAAHDCLGSVRDWWLSGYRPCTPGRSWQTEAVNDNALRQHANQACTKERNVTPIGSHDGRGTSMSPHHILELQILLAHTTQLVLTHQPAFVFIMHTALAN